MKTTPVPPGRPRVSNGVYLQVTVWRIAAVVVNVFLVVYLVATKRLFGVRGGGRAYAAERANQSLLDVEAAATRDVAHPRLRRRPE